jgi:hypothetical protein
MVEPSVPLRRPIIPFCTRCSSRTLRWNLQTSFYRLLLRLPLPFKSLHTIIFSLCCPTSKPPLDLRNSAGTAKLALALRLALLRLADYYGFEDLSQAVADGFGKCYSSLKGELALEVLKSIHPLGLDNAQVEDIAFTYIALNFSEVGKLAVFCEQLEDEIYEKVVDYVARATW